MPISTDIAGTIEVDPKEIWGLLYDPSIIDGIQGETITGGAASWTSVSPITDVRAWPLVSCYVGVYTVAGSTKVDALALRVGPDSGLFSAVGYNALISVLAAPIGTAAGEWIAFHYLAGWPARMADSRARISVRALVNAPGTIVRCILAGKRGGA